jgi:hypothetical protein
MAWESDQPVINYLIRRVKYYKKKRGFLNNSVSNDEFYIQRFSGEKKFKKIILERTREINERIANGEECYKIALEYQVTRNDIATISKIISLTGEELNYKP